MKNLPHSTTIYHELLRPEAYRSGQVPCEGSLYEESQALLFGGADTTGTTLMHGSFYILKMPEIYRKLKAELLEAWPVLSSPPSLSELERLPYLVSPRSTDHLAFYLTWSADCRPQGITPHEPGRCFTLAPSRAPWWRNHLQDLHSWRCQLSPPTSYSESNHTHIIFRPLWR